MGESAMVRESVNRTLESPQDIEVWGFGSECHGGSGESRFAIESGPSEDSAGKEMSEWLQENFVT